ncbi:hypothetical protein Rhopal_006451-T1 [Rhodotorula paludigena]|uniref:BZIP domain-containing protein n=1 Tax=Rhodotorula paludigena TaxID=86838 RepID=A0AAV5GM76_9BASI|nr:hypothetical protein Rhopal_006451-T1 [Rhodotorula paludigena]
MPSQAAQRAQSPLFGDGASGDYAASISQEQQTCTPCESTSLPSTPFQPPAACSLADASEFAASPPPVADWAHLLVPAELAQFVNDDLFGPAACAEPVFIEKPQQVDEALPPLYGPPLIPLASRPTSTRAPLSFPDVNAPMPATTSLSFAQPQERALEFDAGLASPLFDQGSPFDAPGSAYAYGFSNSGGEYDASPAFSDVSPAWVENGDFSTGSSVSPELRDLNLFDPLVQQIKPDPDAIYSPVIAPTELQDIQISPPALLPPPLASTAALFPQLGNLPALPNLPRSQTQQTAIERAGPPSPPATPALDSDAEASVPMEDDPNDSDFNPDVAAHRSVRALSTASPARSTRRSTARSAVSPSAPSASASLAPAVAGARIALDAPIQRRKYQVDSRTSAKPVPKSLRTKRARAEARGEEVPPEAKAIDEAARRREANTLAARHSRAKKAAYVKGLEEENEMLKSIIAELRRANEELRGEEMSKRRRLSVEGEDEGWDA